MILLLFLFSFMKIHFIDTLTHVAYMNLEFSRIDWGSDYPGATGCGILQRKRLRHDGDNGGAPNQGSHLEIVGTIDGMPHALTLYDVSTTNNNQQHQHQQH